jgi:hypothetical protein
MPRLVFLAALLFLVTPGWAQEVALPPDGAFVIAAPEGVLLEWPPAGQAGGPYIVQVYSEQTVVMERDVTGNNLTVPLSPNRAYRWQVSLRKPQGFEPVVASREFQVVSQAEVVVQGADGQPGGPRSGNSYQFDGQPGQNGPSLAVTLTPIGSYASLFVTGGVSANKQYYLSPGSGPFLVGAPGGRGGNGFKGAPAANWGDAGYDGSPGGNGGNGGSGGTITVTAHGLTVSSYLVLNVRGGAGGLAGAAGGPGQQSGVAGQPGRDGQVIVR